MLARKCNILCARYTLLSTAADGCSNSSQSCNMHYYLMHSPFIFMNYTRLAQGENSSSPPQRTIYERANSIYIWTASCCAPIDRETNYSSRVAIVILSGQKTDWLTGVLLFGFDWLPRTAFHAPLPAAAAVCSQKTFCSLAWKQNTTCSQPSALSASLTINRLLRRALLVYCYLTVRVLMSVFHISSDPVVTNFNLCIISCFLLTSFS
jgi:hypothetical protein